MSAAILNTYQWPRDDYRTFILEAIAHAAAATGLFGLFFSIVSRIDFKRETESALVTVLGAHPRLFRSFSTDTKNTFVSGSLKSALGDELGDIVFSEIVSPYLARDVKLRQHYSYEVEAQEQPPEFSKLQRESVVKAVNSLQKVGTTYIWLQQVISYSVSTPGMSGQRTSRFEICFALDKMTLQSLLRDNSIFFVKS